MLRQVADQLRAACERLRAASDAWERSTQALRFAGRRDVRDVSGRLWKGAVVVPFKKKEEEDEQAR